MPFDELTWNELWDFAGLLYPEAKVTFREIQSAPLLQDVPYPLPPSINLAKQGRITEYLQKIHEYMMTLHYNHTGTQFFETKPNSSMLTLMETAKTMIREALPIKCMEAVVLSIYLTNGVPCLGRFPINFKSELPARVGIPQKYFYHVVLGLVHGSKFGAIGLSRRTNLMDKKLEHSTLNDLIQNFDEAYKACGHRLVKVRVGNLISHDSYSIAPIPWKGITIYPRAEEPCDIKSRLERYSRELRSSLRSR